MVKGLSFVLGIGAKILYPFAKHYALRFLKESRVEQRQEGLLRDKFRRQSKTRIGRELGVTPDSTIERLPLTSYGFYSPFFTKPQEGDFMYPLDDYVKAITSGSMGKPKKYMLPRSGIKDNILKTGLSLFLITTHDGEKIAFEIGDVIYRNSAGGSHIGGYQDDIYKKQSVELAKIVPDVDLSFHDKVEYFIENHEEIDVAYMPVTTLLDEISPRIKEPFHLKGFITQDRAAMVFKDKIKEITGNYPKVNYGSTESFLIGLPSIEHPGGFFFDWRIAYCEFLPEENAIGPDRDRVDDPPETMKMGDVEVGKRYQLVVTPFKNDMTRYVMPDIFECIGEGDDVLGTDQPVFSFYARADRLVALHNFTRIAEEELLQVLKDAEVPFVDFTARVEREGAKEYMAMYLELSSPMEVEGVVARVHDELVKFDKDWRDLSKAMNYVPLRARILPHGTFGAYLRRKEGMPRIERIEMREDRLTELLDIAASP
jgi:hypothetical protein